MRETSKLAVISVASGLVAIGCLLLFAVVSFFGLHVIAGPFVIAAICFFVVAFVLGLIALLTITLGGRSLRSYVLACAGLLVSIVPMYFIVNVWLGVRARAELGKAHVGTYNLRVLGDELIKYAQNHDGLLPVAEQWCDALMENNLKLSEANFRHPQSRALGLTGECHFAFNQNLSGMCLSEIPGGVVLVFEADGDWNLNGTEPLLKTRYRKDGYITIMFTNGKMGDYWFYENAVRKFDPKGKHMYYEKPRWKP